MIIRTRFDLGWRCISDAERKAPNPTPAFSVPPLDGQCGKADLCDALIGLSSVSHNFCLDYPCHLLNELLETIASMRQPELCRERSATM